MVMWAERVWSPEVFSAITTSVRKRMRDHAAICSCLGWLKFVPSVAVSRR